MHSVTYVEGKPFFFRSSDMAFKYDTEKKEYYVEGYIATGDLDKGNDVITDECLNDIYAQFKNQNLKLDFEHETLMGKTVLDAQRNITKMPLGKRIAFERDKKGVKIRWKLNPAWKKLDPDGRVVMTFDDVWGAIENKFLDNFSIGYIPKRTKTVVLPDGKKIRKLEKLEMLTTALTGTPMNPYATMTGAFAKSLEWMLEKEEKKMTEEKTEEIKEGVKETKSDEKTETVDENMIEIKSRLLALEKKSEEQMKTIAELKSEAESLKNESAELKKENAELKSILEEARHKAIQQGTVDVKSAETVEVESKNITLDGLLM